MMMMKTRLAEQRWLSGWRQLNKRHFATRLASHQSVYL